MNQTKASTKKPRFHIIHRAHKHTKDHPWLTLFVFLTLVAISFYFWGRPFLGNKLRLDTNQLISDTDERVDVRIVNSTIRQVGRHLRLKAPLYFRV